MFKLKSIKVQQKCDVAFLKDFPQVDFTSYALSSPRTCPKNTSISGVTHLSRW